MKKLTLLIPLLILACTMNAQSIIGNWKTIDDDSGKEKSTVKIYKKGNKYYGKVIEIVDPAKRNSNCISCTDYRKDQPVLGMEILKDLKKDGDEFSNGTIMDPKNGKVYDCKIWLKDKNTLNVRGYVAFFYRTQEWIRVK